MSTDTLDYLFDLDLSEPFDFEEDWLDQEGPFYDLMREAREEVAERKAGEVDQPHFEVVAAPPPEKPRSRRRRQTVAHHHRRERLAVLRVKRLEASQSRRKRQGKPTCQTPELPAYREHLSKRSVLRQIAAAEQSALALR